MQSKKGFIIGTITAWRNRRAFKKLKKSLVRSKTALRDMADANRAAADSMYRCRVAWLESEEQLCR